MKRMMMSTLTIALFAAVLPAMADFALTDSDRVIFFGDETLSSQGYVIGEANFGLMTESFVRVRYPEVKSRFWIFGDAHNGTVENGLKRFDVEVAPHKPTVLVLSFGLGELNGKKVDAEGNVITDEQRYELFQKNLSELLTKSKATAQRVWLVTPICPDATLNPRLKDSDTETKIAKYSELIRTVGTEMEVPVLDWFSASLAYRDDNPKAQLAVVRPNGTDPSPVGSAIATDLLLIAWKAEPMQFSIDVDWAEGKANATTGTVDVQKEGEESVVLRCTGIPLPWNLPGRGNILADKWPLSRYYDYKLKVNGFPDTGCILSEQATGTNKPPREGTKPFLAMQLEQGADVSHIGPFAKCRALGDFYRLISSKNQSWKRAESIRNTPLPEPEYKEAFETFAKGQEQFSEATERVIMRQPRTFDINVEIKTTTAAAAEKMKEQTGPKETTSTTEEKPAAESKETDSK